MGTLAAAAGGAPAVWKNCPSFSPFSLVSGGYLFIDTVNCKSLSGKWDGSIPRDVCICTPEEIRDKDLVFLTVVGSGKYISSLNGLRKVTEDVIDDEETFGSIGWASDV